MNNRDYKQFSFKKKRQFYLHTKTDHPALLKKNIPYIVKYCLSKEFFQQTVNSSVVGKHCKKNLRKRVMTHLRWKPKLKNWNSR